MPWIAAAVGGGLGLLGSSMSAKSQRDAAASSAAAQLESARIAAEAQKFRPVGTTTRFGSSQFTMGPSGYLESAGYTVSPELQQYQDRLSALAGRQLGQAEMAPEQYAALQQGATGLFGLGQQYLAQSPEQVAQQYMQQQQDLLAPGRERQYAQMQQQLFNTGRGGLAVGGTGLRPGGGMGLSAANPEMEAYYNAMAQQDAQLAAQAQQMGQQNVAFGTGLLGSGAGLLGQYQAGQAGALSPFTTTIGGVSSLESLGQQPLDIGAQLGGRAATAGANVGQSLLLGGTGAAKTMQAAASIDPFASAIQGFGNNPQLTGAFSDWARSFNQPSGSSSGGAQYGITPSQLASYYS